MRPVWSLMGKAWEKFVSKSNMLKRTNSVTQTLVRRCDRSKYFAVFRIGVVGGELSLTFPMRHSARKVRKSFQLKNRGVIRTNIVQKKINKKNCYILKSKSQITFLFQLMKIHVKNNKTICIIKKFHLKNIMTQSP